MAMGYPSPEGHPPICSQIYFKENAEVQFSDWFIGTVSTVSSLVTNKKYGMANRHWLSCFTRKNSYC